MEAKESAPIRDLVIGSIAISWAAIFFRLAPDVDPIVASALRLAIAGVLLSPAIVSAHRSGRLGSRVLRAALAGGALYALHFGTWVASLGLTTVAASVTLVTATPILLAAIGLARRRDPPSRHTLIAIAIATTGVVVIGASDASLDASALLGDALALIGAVAMGVYLLVARELGEQLDPFAFSALSALFGALFLGLACALAAALGHDLGAVDPEAMGWIALSALIPQVIGHSLLTRALRRATPTVVGLATCAEPVISTLLAIVILGEVPGAIVAIGCSITLAGVLLGVRRRSAMLPPA